MLFASEKLSVRKICDSREDYTLFHKWLSDLDVCEYYEGRTKPFDYQMVLEKFEERAKGIVPVIAGIISCNNKEIGFLQFYTIGAGEYRETDTLDMSKYQYPYGIDIVIGEKDYWNKGIGTQAILSLTICLKIKTLIFY